MADDIATLPDAVDAEDSTKQKPWEQFAQKKPWDLYSKAPAETKSATATPPPRFDTAQMSAYTPTLRQRASDAFHALRTSQPVETLLGRTDAEKAAVPALQSAPTTSDAGAMGLFTNKKQIIPRVDQPKTVMQGVQNLASEIADSIASPGGIALMAATGGGSAVATAEEQFAAKMAPVAKKLMDLGFRAQGVKMVVDAVRQNINNPNMTPGQLVENIGQALIGTGMAGRAFKGKIKPTTESESQNASKIASGEGVDLREQGAGVGTQAPLRQQGETAGTSEAPQEAQAGALALTPETPSEPVKDQNIGTTAPPETAAPSGAAPTIKNIGDKHGFTYDADFESGDIKLHQFTFRNLPKSDPAYGASFYAKQGATPEEVLKLANDKAEVFRAAKPPTQAAPTETPAKPEPIAAAVAGPGSTTYIADTERHPVVEVPVSEVQLSKDVPNFKFEADPKTGIVASERLGGAYQRVGTAPIVLWERLNGQKEIITGRHRLDLARRTGEKTIPAQIMREADGFTKEQALTFDAEANIRDAQGSVEDYAHYFKNTPSLTEADARSRGLLSRSKGENGWRLGKDSSDDVYALWRDGKITTEKAVAIARAAPGNADLQGMGIKQALKGRSPAEIENFIKAVQIQTGGTAEQVDLFGRDETAIKQAEAMASKASARQTEITDQIRSVQGAAKRPEAASKLGVDVKDPAGVLNRVNELKADLQRWQNWPLHPDLVTEVGGKLKPTPKPTARVAPKSAPGELLTAAETPFNLAGEKAKFVEPTKTETAFGGEKLTQNDLFAIRDIVQEVDPFKSANAAEKMYGGSAQAAKTIQRQLSVMAKDPESYKSFDKKQKARLQEVLNLLNERTAETPAPTEPTIKSPMSAFGKAFYKNTEGQWRQKGKPSASVNASTIDALEQLTKPKAAAQPEMVAMGGDVPHPRPQDFGTTGAPQDIYGVAERVRKARAAAGQVAPVPTGQGVSAEEAVKWGQDLIAMGADPEVSMREFERTRATSFDLISFTRAYGEQLAKSARSVEEKFGTDSIQYRTAQKALSDWDTRTKPIQTEWHKQGMAQQGETDIDTGSFTGINRAFREISGRDLNPAEAKTARKLAADVNEADKATEPAKAGLQTAIDGIAEKGTPVKVAADLESQRKAFGDYESGKPMTPLQVKTLWTRAKTEYIDKGNDSRPDIVHKLAIDLGLPVKDIMRGLEQTKPVRRAADDVWQRQRQARMLKEFAKNWVNHATETWLQKSLPTVARTLFTLKTGLHGTVALGTHAPLVVATHPILFKNNFGRMYHLVLSPEYYEMQQHEIARRPNYTVAQRAGLVNDMSKMEDFSDPKLAQGFPKMAAWFKAKLDKAHLGRVVGMGTRGYSVLKILRQDLFDNAWNKLAESEKSPELAKAIADSVNHITGVTKTGGGVVGKYAHYALFAPKLEASRVAVIATDPVRAVNSLLKMKNMTEAEKWFATNQFKEKASIFAVFTGLMLANQQLNELFGDKKKLNGVPVALGGGGWNPMQSDFGKFRVAGMTFAWGSPFLTMTRLPLRIYQIGAGSGGKTKYLIYPDESMYKTGGSYLRTQASPFISPVISVITKGDYADRPLPQMPGYGKPQPVPKRLAAEGVKPYTWKEFGTGIVLPIPFEEGANEVFHYYDLGQTKAAQNTLLRAFAITLIMAGTGGRMAEDWNKPKPRAANPAWSPPP